MYNFNNRILRTALRRTHSTIHRCVSTYKCLEVDNPHPKVYHVQLNRPEKMNAMNTVMWLEIGKVFNELSAESDCRVILLSGKGKVFSSGIDLGTFIEIMPRNEDPAHKSLNILQSVYKFQDAFTALEKCRKPVIAAVHGACIGGGMDLITAADIRLMSSECYMQVKEVDIGIVADVGTIQRLPKVIGNQSLVAEYCLTGRKIPSDEAARVGLVSRVLVDREALMDDAMALAKDIASKSPVAVQGTKSNLVYSRDHTVHEGLERVAVWNSAMLLGGDPMKAVSGAGEFEDPS